MALDALGQCGCTQQEEEEIPRQEEQELMGAGVLDPGEEQQAHDQLAPRQTGQSGQLSLCCKDEAQRDKDEIEQAQPSEVVECLEGQTAAVIVGVAACVVIGEDVGYHGPEQDDHGGDGRKAEEDEVLSPAEGGGDRTALCQLHTACDEQQHIGEIVAHHEVEEPPAGEDDGGSGEEDKAEPGRFEGVKTEVQRQQQDGEGEDEAEPVRLCQHSAHPQEGISRRQGHAEEEVIHPVLHVQELADLHHEARQKHQQGRQDAEHLTEGVGVAGVVGQAEGKLGEEGDEVGVIVGHRAEEITEAPTGALGKSGFGVILLEQVVGVVPDVDKAPAR